MAQQTKADNEKFCSECGSIINIKAEICPKCGVRQFGTPMTALGGGQTDKRILPLLILGFFGLHYFYLGKAGTGVLFVCTAGGLLIWYFMDLIKIVSGSFLDANGVKITQWV